ncbi:hypothetical protein [Lysobacter solisilvae (ex Woo and Kim 2020)]|uniref:Uncharacterized protein n=1 Tax=Agrilutibacter terrestris TaxID=2865112 RepID=A0A7H0G085_9GAMM|nr:hypothetical protein [Lysobacter terrestris]QNP41701.1 hypothetical protein H8B22_05700 [Lysobacter terrestris]
MKPLSLALAALALAAASLAATPVHAAPSECTPAGDCTAYRNRLSIPAHALSYGGAAFTLDARGIDWANNSGTATLTMRRPLDFRGDKVRLTFVYQATSGLPGSNVFAVDAIAFHHGSGFETYGGFLSPALELPEDATALLEQSTVVEPGEGWNPEGPWWYFEIHRLGSNNASLRLMAVTLEY